MAASGSAPGNQTLALSNGVLIPIFGFGCAFGDWTSSDTAGRAVFTPEDAWEAIPKALRAGVRHFDCAYVYRSHRQVGTSLGMAFREGLVKRQDLFITTKVFHPAHPALFGKSIDFEAPDLNLKSVVKKHILESLEELGVGYVDLLLVHWPGNFGSKDKAVNRAQRKAVWDVFEDAYAAGMTRAVGVSNFTEEHFRELEQDGAKVVPHVNQIECSPHCQYSKIIDYCKAKNIVIQAYSPLGSTAGGVLKDPLVTELASKYKKDNGQLVLKWLIQQGMVVLPRSSSEKRMASNMDVFDFTISDEDMLAITALNKGKSSTNANPYDFP